MKLLIENTTMTIWATFVVLLGLGMSLGQLGLFMITAGIWNGFAGLLLGATLITENAMKGFRKDTGSIILLVVAVFMLLFGFASLMATELPRSVASASSMLYLISSIGVAVALVTK